MACRKTDTFAVRGFTLLEILLAIFIFTIVVTTMLGSYNAVFSNVGALNRSIEAHQMGRSCMNRMTADLEALYVEIPPGYTPPDIDDPPDPHRIIGEEVYGGTETFPRLRFTALAHLPFGDDPRDGVAEVVYYVQWDPETGGTLRRADSLFPDYRYDERGGFEERPSDPILCESVKSLTYTFLDADGREHDHWNSETDEFDFATPRALGIELEIGDEFTSISFQTMVAFPIFREKKE